MEDISKTVFTKIFANRYLSRELREIILKTVKAAQVYAAFLSNYLYESCAG